MFDNNPKKKSNYDPFQEDFRNSLKMGLDLQREIFKDANINSHYDVMNKTLENIYNEIKSKVNDTEDKTKLNKVKTIVYWYYQLPINPKYKKKTQRGYQIIYPENIDIKINKLLNLGYQILITQLNKLKLL